MPVIAQPAAKIDRRALSFVKVGAGGGTFARQVIGAIQANPNAIPTPVNSLEWSEIAELAQQQDDTLFCRLINNNVNLRYTATAAGGGLHIKPTIPTLAALGNLVPFDHKDFSGGGMEQTQNLSLFTSNKCGVYRVSFGLFFTGNGGINATDPQVVLVRRRWTTGGYSLSNPYSGQYWRVVGLLNKFWANGCDLIELEVGDSVGICVLNSAVAGAISSGQFDYTAWIAINYTGNQH